MAIYLCIYIYIGYSLKNQIWVLEHTIMRPCLRDLILQSLTFSKVIRFVGSTLPIFRILRVWRYFSFTSTERWDELLRQLLIEKRTWVSNITRLYSIKHFTKKYYWDKPISPLPNSLHSISNGPQNQPLLPLYASCRVFPDLPIFLFFRYIKFNLPDRQWLASIFY